MSFCRLKMESNKSGNVDYKYFIDLALKKNISWNLVAMFFDESTSTLEKSKELNKILVEELKNLQVQLDDLIAHRKVENNVIDVHQESITAPLDDGNTDSDQSKNSNSIEKEKKEKRKFDCSICQNKFASKFSLERHQKLHSKEIQLSENSDNESINVPKDGSWQDFNSENFGVKRVENESSIESDETHSQTQDVMKNDENKLSEHDFGIEITQENIVTTDGKNEVESADKKLQESIQEEEIMKDVTSQKSLDPLESNEQESNHNTKSFDKIENITELQTSNENEQMDYEIIDKEDAVTAKENKKSYKEKPYPCSVCPKGFFQLSNYKCHMKKCHPGEVILHLNRKESFNRHKPIQCGVCSKGFLKLNNFRYHMKKYHPDQTDARLDQRSECETCGKTFFDSYKLKRHEQIHAKITKITQFICTFCGKEFTRQFSLDRHLKHHTGEMEKKFECKDCDKRYFYAAELKVHERKHLQPEKINAKLEECDICGKKVAHMMRHLEVHSGNRKMFECMLCHQEFTYSASLNDHKRIHSGEKPFSCETCDKRFSRKSSLRSHKLSHNAKALECNICGKMFKTNKQLIYHKRNHTDDPLFKCKVCSKNFIQRVNLRSHEKIHTDNKFYCGYCSKRFIYRSDFDAHKEIHKNEEKSHKCTYCEKAFSKKIVLYAHLKSHLGKKNFKCTECDKSFLRNWMLNRHLTIHKSDPRNVDC